MMNPVGNKRGPQFSFGVGGQKNPLGIKLLSPHLDVPYDPWVRWGAGWVRPAQFFVLRTEKVHPGLKMCREDSTVWQNYLMLVGDLLFESA